MAPQPFQFVDGGEARRWSSSPASSTSSVRTPSRTLVALARSPVVADLAHLELVEPSGLSRSRRRVEEAGQHLVIRGARGATRRAFEAAGLVDVLDDRGDGGAAGLRGRPRLV